MTEAFPASSTEAGHFMVTYGPEVWLTAQAVNLSYISPVPLSEAMFGTEQDEVDIQRLVAEHFWYYLGIEEESERFDDLPAVHIETRVLKNPEDGSNGLDIAIVSTTYKTDVVYSYRISSRRTVVYSAVQHTPHDVSSQPGGDGRFRDISQAGVQQWRAAAVLRLSWELHLKHLQEQQQAAERGINLVPKSA